MLVKRSLVESWYQKNSWVYKNFSYLFQNPLWHKSVPRGFSVCPYFWLSLFSFCIVRPLVWCVERVVRIVGGPLDRKLFNGMKWVGLGGDFDYFRGAGALIVFARGLSVVAGLIPFIVIFAFFYDTYSFLVEYDDTGFGLFAFWSAVSFFLILISISIPFPKRVKSTHLLVLWVAGFVIGCFTLIQNHTLAFFYLVGAAGVNGFKFVILFLWAIFKSILVWVPISEWFIPWWGYLMFLALLLWGLRKVNLRGRAANLFDFEIQAANREVWKNLFIKILCRDPYYGKGMRFQDYSSRGRIICNDWQIQHLIYSEMFELLWGAGLDKLQVRRPLEKSFKAINFSHLENYECSGFIEALSDETIHEKIQDVMKLPYIKDRIDEVVAEYELSKKTKEQNRQKRQSAWWYKGLAGVANFSDRVADVLALGVLFLCRGGCKIGKQGLTFLAYCWMLLKAKKQGACPYFTFTDPKNNENARDNG